MSLAKEYLTSMVFPINIAPSLCHETTSHGTKKIVRSDDNYIFYIFYRSPGLKNLERWREDPLYLPWYYQTGLAKVIRERFDNIQTVIHNQQELRVDVKIALIVPKKLKTM